MRGSVSTSRYAPTQKSLLGPHHPPVVQHLPQDRSQNSPSIGQNPQNSASLPRTTPPSCLPEALLREILHLLLTGHPSELEEHVLGIDDLSAAAITCHTLRAQADAIFDERLARSTAMQRGQAEAWRLAGFRLLQICDMGSSYLDPKMHAHALYCVHMDWLRKSGIGGCGMMERSTLALQIGSVFPVLFEWNREGRAHEARTWSSSRTPIVMVGATLTYTNGPHFSLAVLGTLQQASAGKSNRALSVSPPPC